MANKINISKQIEEKNLKLDLNDPNDQTIGLLVTWDKDYLSEMKGKTMKEKAIITYKQYIENFGEDSEKVNKLRRALMGEKIYDNTISILVCEEFDPLIINTYDDFPEDSIPCLCGNPNHWLIKYEETEPMPDDLPTSTT